MYEREPDIPVQGILFKDDLVEALKANTTYPGQPHGDESSSEGSIVLAGLVNRDLTNNVDTTLELWSYGVPEESTKVIKIRRCGSLRTRLTVPMNGDTLIENGSGLAVASYQDYETYRLYLKETRWDPDLSRIIAAADLAHEF